MSTPAKRRLMRDLKDFREHNVKTIFAQPLEDDMLTWIAVILGPENSLFQDGTFSLIISFTENYPQTPPNIKFLSKMFHPNIYPSGDLCLDILKNKWSPSFDVLGILLSVQSLLNDPNIKSPADIDAANLLNTDYDEYCRRVRESVENSWVDMEVMKEKLCIDDVTEPT